MRGLERWARQLSEWLAGDDGFAPGLRVLVIFGGLAMVVWWFWRLDRKVTAISLKLGMRPHPFYGNEVASGPPDSR